MRGGLMFFLLFAGVTMSVQAVSGMTPVPVSPGEAQGVAVVGDGCPLFSWSAVSGASGYELAVF